MIAASDTRPLAVGEARTAIRVSARRRWNPLGVLARPGETFLFACQGRWWDLHLGSGPEGQPGNCIQRRVEHLKRMRDAPWFCVIGSLGTDGEALFAIGAGGKWTNTTRRTAPLYAFANDVPGFYWNNWGAIRMEVRRTR